MTKGTEESLDPELHNYDAEELTTIFNEGATSFQHGLMEGATTQPFTSIEDEYQRTTVPPRRANDDLSQKYRKVNPTCTAPVMKVQQKRRQKSASESSGNSEESSGEEIDELQEKAKAVVESTLEHGSASSGPLAASPKAKGKGTKKANAKMKNVTKAKAKNVAKAKTKNVTKANASKPEDLTEMEKWLNESTKFEPPSAFRRKSGVAVNAEEKRIVGIEEQGPLTETKSAPSKKRKRPSAVDWDREYPDATSEVPENGGLGDEELIKIGLDRTY